MTTKQAATKFDPYQAVTDQVIALLESGTAPWHKPWSATFGMPRSLSTRKPYRGINPFLLAMSAHEQGFTSPWWATYNHIHEMGGQVRKGEHGTLIVFWRSYLDRNEVDAKGDPKRRFVLRTYKVFNADQADNLTVPELAPRATLDPIDGCQQVADAYLASGGPTVSFGSTIAAYTPLTDSIEMPALQAFESAEEFYSTYFHELGHSTGHGSRLDREGIQAFGHFGDTLYSKEELVAEMTSAMLAGQTGISPATLDNSAAYLAHWATVLKGDAKLVVSAAAQAQRAADLILGVTFSDDEQQPAEPALAVA